MTKADGQISGTRFPARLRVRRRRGFERGLARGVRLSDGRLTIWAISNAREYPRLGLMVGRKHGNAVRRNRIKRVLREAFRLSRHSLPGGLDLLCAPRVGAAVDLVEWTESLLRLADRAQRRLAKRGDANVPPA